jgi:hypothetical protein
MKPNDAGIIDNLFSLSSLRDVNNNAYAGQEYIIITSSNTQLTPDPNAFVVKTSSWVQLENGSASYALVTGSSYALGDDADSGNDGTLDGVSTLDAVGFRENGSDVVYGTNVTPSNARTPT